VTVNAIAPGYMETEINDDFKADPPRYEWIRNRTPMKRWDGGRDRRRRGVPRQRRLGLRHRPRAGGRRWDDDRDLTPGRESHL
jgi:NAD(P)-dependent dehydrogenase (short-subunit alcohol dehydrogenase family)